MRKWIHPDPDFQHFCYSRLVDLVARKKRFRLNPTARSPQKFIKQRPQTPNASDSEEDLSPDQKITQDYYKVNVQLAQNQRRLRDKVRQRYYSVYKNQNQLPVLAKPKQTSSKGINKSMVSTQSPSKKKVREPTKIQKLLESIYSQNNKPAIKLVKPKTSEGKRGISMREGRQMGIEEYQSRLLNELNCSERAKAGLMKSFMEIRKFVGIKK